MWRLDALRALLALPDPDDLPRRSYRCTQAGNKQKLQAWRKAPTPGSARWIWRFLAEKKPRGSTAAHEQETKQ